LPLAKRIIPCLDVDHGKVVKGIHFRNLKNTGYPSTLAKKYCDDGADEIVFLDITASPEKRKILEKFVREVAMVLDIPFTVGGGISNLDDALLVLHNGADKVSINTSAVNDHSLVNKLSNKFGEQCIVVAVDAKRRLDLLEDRIVVADGENRFWFELYTYGGSKATNIDAIKWVKQVEELGAGEILLTSIDRDGTQNGYDIELTRKVAETVNIPVIASGGCGKIEHILDVFQQAKADAALAASIFHYEKYSIQKVKSYLDSKGISVRL
jgi:cyclase